MATDRAEQIRAALKEGAPSTMFANDPPSGAGIHFGQVANAGRLRPVACAPYLATMSEHLSDENFGAFLLGLSEWVKQVLELTDQDPDNFTDDTFADAQEYVERMFPRSGEMLAECLDFDH